MILFFIWIYINWVILLIGCSIAFYHQNPAQQNLDSAMLNLSNREKESIALNIMTLIGKHYYSHKPAWTNEALALQMKISIDACTIIINHLLNKNLLQETSQSPITYLPAFDLETLSLHDIISAIRESDETRSHSLERIDAEGSVIQIQKEIDESIEQLLKDRSLKDLSI